MNDGSIDRELGSSARPSALDREFLPKAPEVRPTCGRTSSRNPGYAGPMRNTG
jgi:hypothetical protein